MPDQILDLIRREQSFFITTHISPDGDALGSQLALGLFLERLGKQVTMINSDSPPYNLAWLPSIDRVQLFDGSLEQRHAIDEADVSVMVDLNAFHRLGRVEAAFKNANGVKALIDHHTNPEEGFDFLFVRDRASSTAELIYDIISAWDASLIDTDIATLLYCGLMTDTGSFRFNSVTPRVHRIVADLLERGDITPAPIHTSIYDTRSRAGLRLLGLALDSITTRYDDQVAYMVLSQRMMRETGASKDEAEGFVNYALSIESVRAAVIFTELERGVKMSFRSKADTYVHKWARHFGGGGHRNASGAFVQGGITEVIDRVLNAAPRFLQLETAESSDELSIEDQSYLETLLANRS